MPLALRLVLLLLLELVVAGDEEDVKEARFPTALVIHGGYRPTMGTDTTRSPSQATYTLFTVSLIRPLERLWRLTSGLMPAAMKET